MKKKTSLPGFVFFLGILSVTGVSCLKNDTAGNLQSNSIFNMKVSPYFKFRTTQELGIKIYTLDNTGAPVPNMRIEIYTDTPQNNGSMILSGVTDTDGLFISDYKFPAGIDSITVGTTAVGFCNMQKVKVIGGAVNLTLGGKIIGQSTNSCSHPQGRLLKSLRKGHKRFLVALRFQVCCQSFFLILIIAQFVNPK